MDSVNEVRLASLVAERLQHMGFVVDDAAASADSSADLVVTWPDGGHVFAVDVKLHAPRGLPRRRAAMSDGAVQGRWILALPHVTRGEGADLRASGVRYVDSGGNAWIDAPGLTLWIEGRKPAFELRGGLEKPSRAFRPTGLRVLFVVLCEERLLNASQREIAAAAGVSLGAVSNTFTDLRNSGLLRESRGRRVLPDRRRLSQTWVEHYVSTLRPSLHERRVDGPDPRWWVTEEAANVVRRTDMQFGGETALERSAAGLRAEETVLYGPPPWQDIVRELRMPMSGEGRVVLRERFWASELCGGELGVPPLLIMADAVASGDERQIESAEQLFGGSHEFARTR